MTQTIDRPAGQQAASPVALGEALKIALDGPYHELREEGRNSLTADDLIRDPDMTVAEARAWTTEHLLRLAALGRGNAGYPVEGRNADPLAAVVSFETIGHGDLSLCIKAGVQFGLWGGAVAGLGSQEQIDTWLPEIISTRLLGCFAMTEVGHGSDVQSLETTLTYDAATDEIVVNSPTPAAIKTYIGNAAQDGRMAAVFGQLWVGGTCHGVHCAIVGLRDADGTDSPGVTTGDNGHKGGLHGVDNGTLAFDNVRVPRAQLLNRYGGVNDAGRYESSIENQNRRFFTMLGTLVRGRVCVGAAGAIAGRKALSIAVRYGLKRKQFPAPGREDGVTLLDYQSHQMRLFPWVAKAYALGFAHNELLGFLVERQTADDVDSDKQRLLESRAAGLKVAETRFANDVAQEAREACGGAGYMSENYLPLLRADVDIFATFEGDNTVLQQLVAKNLLVGYRAEWTGLDRRAVIAKTADLVGRTVLERTAARGLIERLEATAMRRSGEASVLDRGWQAWMFDEREQHVLEGLAERFRAASKTKSDRYGAMNRLQEHMLMAARVHTDRLILEAFIAGIEATEDAAAKVVLEKLCDLYALDSLAADRGWFAEHNRMSASRAKNVVRQVEQLCAELRPHALELVEGLGVPADWLGSAMLRD